MISLRIYVFVRSGDAASFRVERRAHREPGSKTRAGSAMHILSVQLTLQLGFQSLISSLSKTFLHVNRYLTIISLDTFSIRCFRRERERERRNIQAGYSLNIHISENPYLRAGENYISRIMKLLQNPIICKQALLFSEELNLKAKNKHDTAGIFAH